MGSVHEAIIKFEMNDSPSASLANNEISDRSANRNSKVRLSQPEHANQNHDLNSSGCSTFIQHIKEDFRIKKLITLKALFFIRYAAVFVFYQFLPLHLKFLGLDEVEAGGNSALFALISIVGPPAAGIISDRIGNFKYLLAGITLMNAPLALILLFVPKARDEVHFPEQMTFSLGCSTSYSHNSTLIPFVLRSLDSNNCSNYTWNGPNLSSVMQCGKLCPINPVSTRNAFPLLTQLPVPISSNSTEPYHYVLQGQKFSFTPFSSHNPVCKNYRCFAEFIDGGIGGTGDLLSNIIFSSILLSPVSAMDEALKSMSVTYPEFLVEFFLNEQFYNNSNTICSKVSETHHYGNAFDVCSYQCLVHLNRAHFCSNQGENKVHNVALTMWMYAVVRVILEVTSTTAHWLFEGAVIAILKEHGGDFGLQKVSATLAAVIFAPLAGVLNDVSGGFTASFCLYAFLQVICAVLTLRIDLSFKLPAPKIFRNLKDVLSKIEILIFFAALFVSGAAWGYLETFLFWFLKELGASNFLMGFTISVGGLAGIIVLLASEILIKKLGHVNILCLGLLFYGFRLIGYSFIENPWWCLTYEAMEGITTALATAVAALYSSLLSNRETTTTIQGIWGSLYFGIGRASGSYFGGLLVDIYGHRHTFRIFAIISFIGAILYFTLYNLHNKYSIAKQMSLESFQASVEKYAREFQKNKLVADLSGNHLGYPVPYNHFRNVPLNEVTSELIAKI